MFMLLTNYCSVFFFKQKTAYELRISDWSSDVCSSDLGILRLIAVRAVSRVAPKRPIAKMIVAASSCAGTPMISRSPARRASSPASQGSTKDRKSVVSGKSVFVRLDLGGRRIIKKKYKRHKSKTHNT